MATTTNNYKQTSHLPRVVYTEAAPLSGMNYTNVPLASGYAKIVYNLVENPDSTGLRSRPGAVKVNDPIDLPTEVLTTELQYNATANTFAMKNYFRGKLIGTIIAVDSEYGRIYHYLYYGKDYIEGKGPLELLYTNELPLETKPHKLDDNYFNSEIEEEISQELIETAEYIPTPVLNDAGDFVATKAFETNDIILLCSQTKYTVAPADWDLNNKNREWFSLQWRYDYTKLLANITNYKNVRYNTKEHTITNVDYNPLPYRHNDYQLELIPTSLTYYPPNKPYTYYKNGNNSAGIRYAVGYDNRGDTYITNVMFDNTQHKFNDVFQSEINSICLYKLPTKPRNNTYHYDSQKLTGNTPLYVLNITNIKITKKSETQASVTYDVSDSLGNSNTISVSNISSGIIVLYTGPVGFYDLLKQVNKTETPIGVFTIITSSENTTLNKLRADFYYDKLNGPRYEPLAGSTAKVMGWITSSFIKINIVGLESYLNNITKPDTPVDYPSITYNFYFTDLSNAPQKIMPKQPTVNEALKYGYNMLLTDPYNFTGTKSSSTANTIHFGGLLTYDDNDEIVLNPIMNKTYRFRLITDTTSSTTRACVIIDYKTTAQDVWNRIYDDRDKGLILSDYANDVKFSWQPGVSNAIVRVRYYAKTDKELKVNPETNLAFENLEALTTYLATATTGTYDKNIFAVKSYSTTVYYRALFTDKGYTTVLEYYPEAGDATEDTLFKQGYRNLRTVPIAMSFERNYETNVSVRNYDFSTAQGMCYWFNRLVVWGVDGGANVLFLSDINDPSYFPYPNNISVFDETVIKALPFQDSLLVFTTTKIWRIDLAEDGMSWYESCIQQNLRIDSKDAHLIEALTTMIFFKSGYLYYLLTPSSKGTGELVIANISKPVIDILQNPDKFFESMENAVYAHYYSNDNKLKLEEHNVYVDSSEIHIVYSYSGTYFDDAKVIDATDNTPSINTLRNYILSYNTNTRKWRVWSFDSDQVPRVLYKDAVGGLVWYTISSRIKDLVKTKTSATPTTYTLQNKLYTFQFMLNDINNADIYDEGVPGGHRAYQYLDTGNRDIRKEYYKKFREYQVVFNNRSDNDLQFDIQFCIDDNIIIPLFDGTVTAEADDSLYGSTEQTVFGTVKTLDTSLVFTINKTMWDKFHTVKCKVPVASKGYAPALRILSKNRHSYDLLNITWVYRLKNAR